MLVDVTPIISTQFDWQKYLTTAKQALGRSVTQQLDNRHQPANSPEAFLVTLGSVQDPDATPNEIVRNPGSLLRHVFFGFQVVSSVEYVFQLATETGLHVMSAESINKNYRYSIVSGNLELWRAAVINGCSPISSNELREVMAKFHFHFEKNGLGMLWQNFEKKPNNLLLERR